MRVRFWGTRGSIPSPGAHTLRYGGNTTCVEVRTADGTLLVLDCGSGARGLGGHLLRNHAAPLRGHLLLSHTHWDHIQGMPFFAPLYADGGSWEIYGPHPGDRSLRDTLALQMQPPFFPIRLEDLPARISFHHLAEGTFTIGEATITTQVLNHPGPTLGYRIEADGQAVVYACDHEPHGDDPSGATGDLSPGDRRHIAFLAGADLVIHDAQYLAREYEVRRGWGHSVGEYVIEVCRRAGVRRVGLTHHDPSRTDESIDTHLGELLEGFAGADGLPEVFAAAEGDVIDLMPRAGEEQPPLA